MESDDVQVSIELLQLSPEVEQIAHDLLSFQIAFEENDADRLFQDIPESDFEKHAARLAALKSEEERREEILTFFQLFRMVARDSQTVAKAVLEINESLEDLGRQISVLEGTQIDSVEINRLGE